MITETADQKVAEVSLDSANDIPQAALVAYKRAALAHREVRPRLPPRLVVLAGIGRVESNHGRYGGSQVYADGSTSPHIVGLALNGVGNVASISDTDGGKLDGDTTWDRAVGPMQFIPSTWAVVGTDADGDGVRDPHDIDDAALSAGVYLCAGDRDLGRTPAYVQRSTATTTPRLRRTGASHWRTGTPRGTSVVPNTSGIAPITPAVPVSNPTRRSPSPSRTRDDRRGQAQAAQAAQAEPTRCQWSSPKPGADRPRTRRTRPSPTEPTEPDRADRARPSPTDPPTDPPEPTASPGSWPRRATAGRSARPPSISAAATWPRRARTTTVTARRADPGRAGWLVGREVEVTVDADGVVRRDPGLGLLTFTARGKNAERSASTSAVPRQVLDQHRQRDAPVGASREPGMFGRRSAPTPSSKVADSRHRRSLGQPAVRGHDRVVDAHVAAVLAGVAPSGARSSARCCARTSGVSWVYFSGLGGIGAAPQPGDRREVVGGDRRHRRTRPGLGFVGLEVEQPVGQDLSLGEGLAYAVLDRAEVLAYDDRLLAMRLERDDVEEVRAGVAHVGPVGRSAPLGTHQSRNSPITWSIRSPPASAMVARIDSMNGT